MFFKFFLGAAALALISLPSPPAAAKSFAEMFPNEAKQLNAEGHRLMDGLDFKQGKVVLPGGIATLEVSGKYYFLNAADAARVLVDAWKNPDADGVLGLLLPVQASPLDGDSWGLVISYDEIGHVSDADASSEDYGALLKQMQAASEEGNADRRAKGFAAVHLVGWAEPPHYDWAKHDVYWAKELHFDDAAAGEDTLNFNIRALGRKGVLVMNFVAPMSALAQVKAAVPDVLAMTTFGEGSRYEDFSPSVDKVAAVGVAGLIAGTAALKPGLLLVALALAKKFFVLLLIPVVWLRKKLSGGRRGS